VPRGFYRDDVITRIPFVFCLALAASATRAADDTSMPSAHDILRARLAEAGKSQSAAPAPGAPITDTARAVIEDAAAKKNPPPAPAPASTGAATKSEAQKQPANVLPQLEVKKSRITEADVQVAKTNREIAREKQNTKPTELDKALNDSKIAKPLAMFGGESTQFRKQVSKQRIALMEDEKDLIEAIAQAKTKEEKAELQKELDALRAERRELERAMR
jgi:hypothetical protein